MHITKMGTNDLQKKKVLNTKTVGGVIWTNDMDRINK